MPTLALSEVAPAIAKLAPGERLIVIGGGRDRIGEIVSQNADRSRSLLLVNSQGDRPATTIIDTLLDDLADLALAQSRHRSVRDAAALSACTDPWLRAASRRVGHGLRPRLRRFGQQTEFDRLLKVIEPQDPVLVWEIDPASATRARPVIEALEWCTRHGAAVVAGLVVEPPGTAPYDRVLYGAYELAHAERGAVERFITPTGAHHASVIEQRVAVALEMDAELRGLFECNSSVPIGRWGSKARVDLLCPNLRIVVELDGPEHRAEPKFSDDRHRDYELLSAGYLVLRMTNDQVATDLPLAIEKIRSIVHLRHIPERGLSQ